MNIGETGWEEAYLLLCEEAHERIRAAEARRAEPAYDDSDGSLADALAVADRQLQDAESDRIQAAEVHYLMMALALERSVPDWN